MKSINVTLPKVGELELMLIGSQGPLTYWKDTCSPRIYSYNLDTARFVDRGDITELSKLPPTLQPRS